VAVRETGASLQPLLLNFADHRTAMYTVLCLFHLLPPLA
jgi:hypothetical protein